MGANIQWLSERDGQIGVFRCGEGFNKFGDPWEMVSVIQTIKDDGLHMFGVQSNMRATQIFRYFPTIKKLMKDEGVKYIIWEKLRPDGSMKHVRIEI